MRIELLTHGRHRTHTGIGRYVHTLHQHLGALADVELCQLRYLPLSDRISYLRQLPMGIAGHRSGSIVHFPQITGCAMMLYRPYHPSVATVHDLGVLELVEEWAMHDLVARQMLRLSLAGLKRVDRIVTVSEFTRQSVIRHLGVCEDRVIAVHSGIDHKLFRPVSGAREMLIGMYRDLAAFASAPWLLYVGSELPRKNVGTLLLVMALLREKIPDLRLIKVGLAGGESFRRETLRTIEVLGLDDHVLIFEGVSNEALPIFYSSADLFVSTSILEGFGLPVLEAMACGCPPVVSNATSLREVAGDGGILVDPEGVEGWAQAILEVLQNDHLHAELKQRGLERAAMFDWGRTAEETIRVYEMVIRGVRAA